MYKQRIDPGDRRTIIAVDFDGTICENQFPLIGAVRQNCMEVLKHLQSQGVVIILWTCRDGALLNDAIAFCHENDFFPDAVNENWQHLPFQTSNKIYADFYVDDKSMEADWWTIMPEILRFDKDAFIVIE